jgi:site-specific recombinase XerD
MTTIYSTATSLQRLDADGAFDEAQLAAAAFLARYSGRTLDAYRHDLRGFFQWSADVGLTVLAATRPHIELYRGWMEDRGLAASTIDRRLSTVCGYYRLVRIDGRIPSNPPSTSADRRCSQARATAWIAANLAPSCSLPSASITPTPRLPCSSG